MAEFLLALFVFLVLHSIPATPTIRERLIGMLGRATYFSLYSLVSILVLGWVFYSALSADYVPLWEPAAWQAWVTLMAAPVGVFLVLAGLFSVNPLSASIRQGAAPGAVVAITRHPVLWGFALWALGHLVANGDLRSFILFGGFAVFALASIPMLDKRARRRLGEKWSQEAASTSILPFAAIISGRTRIRGDAPLALAAASTAALTVWLLGGGHAALFYADPLLLATAY
ncbi:NnrU family protein [Sinorhizobium americanum]|uniref:Putative membrane protein n=1 Tax=Sinorhizobium americanum TaxID=194963 RepID=A0A1L3LKK2_9HYPH|nr:NnrU family protein [Sinorhizobium americanum]APG84061.1 regulatory protein NnrU [Sinorhizobium americanum CCGM7]APG90611.1 regulatory protein NnrU [Sinorhizobium americanum]OAP48055.1 NnrU family protein [Sinorhizobium americanum]TCN31003.1 putative membrane protein [Sinorhizobium americanum]